MPKILILINTRDLLDSVIAQVEFFSRVPDAYIVILDNASTYPPLIEWYRKMTGDSPRLGPVFHGRNLTFYFLPENRGPRAGSTILEYLDATDARVHGFQYYFMSDADMDYSDLDPHFLTHLIRGLDRYPDAQGCGVSIRIDDLPDTPMGRKARETEAGNWQHHPTQVNYSVTHPVDSRPLHHSHQSTDLNYWIAGCDTAGVLRRRSPMWDGTYMGLRSTRHVARHRPWYFLPGQVPPDFQYFYQHANPEGTCYTAAVLDPTTGVDL